MVLDTNLIIYGQRTWCILDLKGKITKTNFFVGDGEIHFIKMLETLDSYSMIRLGELQLTRHFYYFLLITFYLSVVNTM